MKNTKRLSEIAARSVVPEVLSREMTKNSAPAAHRLGEMRGH